MNKNIIYGFTFIFAIVLLAGIVFAFPFITGKAVAYSQWQDSDGGLMKMKQEVFGTE